MFRRMMMRAIGVRTFAVEPFEGEVDGTPYHADATEGGGASIWIDLSGDQLAVEPRIFRRDPDWIARSQLEHVVAALFNLGADVVAIGSGRPRVEAVFKTPMRPIDRALAEQVVCLLIGVRLIAAERPDHT